jgi:hypothetical protein
MEGVDADLIATAWTRGDWLSGAGLVVSSVGFLFAAWQLVRTARATEATAEAVRASSRGQLLLLLPQFKLYELELDYALEQDNKPYAARILTSCSHLASEVSGLLSTNRDAFAVEDETITALKEVAALAGRAKASIYDSPSKKLAILTREFREVFGVSIQAIAQLQASAHSTPTVK